MYTFTVVKITSICRLIFFLQNFKQYELFYFHRRFSPKRENLDKSIKWCTCKWHWVVTIHNWTFSHTFREQLSLQCEYGLWIFFSTQINLIYFCNYFSKYNNYKKKIHEIVNNKQRWYKNYIDIWMWIVCNVSKYAWIFFTKIYNLCRYHDLER